ncbi:signal transduction histidine kinase [hydrocarbon metagenome]|uniref:histidine kinase n=1 Tax=hydrocarbon metagenome TaxID=938273 RepID=A0A0W8FI58_9ZZZZ
MPAHILRRLEKVSVNTRTMTEVIDNILNFSRMGRSGLNKKFVYPAEIVQEVLSSLRTEQEGREVEIITSDLPPCEADPSMIRQVYFNLLSNALKFTRKCPVVRIEIGSFLKGDSVIYYVKDNGVGFNMQHAGKLFGVFERLHPREYGGTGVGLAIVQLIVPRHGGSIRARSVANQGASFFFTLRGGMSNDRKDNSCRDPPGGRQSL